MHVPVEHHNSAVREALPGEDLQKGFLAPEAIEEQAEPFPAPRPESPSVCPNQLHQDAKVALYTVSAAIACIQLAML